MTHFSHSVVATRGSKSTMSGVLRQRWFSVLVLVVIALSAGAYLMLASAESTSGYEVTTLKQELAALKQQTETLETRAAELQGLSKLAESLPPDEFVVTDSIEYLAQVPVQVGVAVR